MVAMGIKTAHGQVGTDCQAAGETGNRYFRLTFQTTANSLG